MFNLSLTTPIAHINTFYFYVSLVKIYHAYNKDPMRNHVM